MKKKIWSLLILAVVGVAVFGFPEKKTEPKPEVLISVEEDSAKPEQGMALSAASTDLSVVLNHKNRKPAIRIAAFLPLSGATAEQGTALKNALLLAKQDIRYQNPKYDYRFMIEDNQNPAAAYKEMNNLNAVISFGAESGNILAPLAETDKIVHVNFGAPEKSAAEGKYNFIVWTMPERLVERLIDFYQEQNWKSITVIGEHTAEFDALTAELQKQAEQAKIQITSVWLPDNKQDFAAALHLAEEFKAEAYLLLLKKDSLAAFLAQYEKAGIPKPLTTINTFADMSKIKLPDGACYADVAQSTNIFHYRVKEEYPDTNSYFALGTVYDIVMLLVQTFENAATPDEAVDILAKTEEYDGVIGPVVQDNNGIFDSRAVIKCLNNGNAEIIFDPKAAHSHGHFEED